MKFARGFPIGFVLANELSVGAVLYFVLADPEFIRSQRQDFAHQVLTAVGGLGILWVLLLIFFFRDPDRVVGPGVVSAADGRVTKASVEAGEGLVSVFLGIFNVHVVRAPVAGRIIRIDRRGGAKRFAFSKDSANNERVVFELEAEEGTCSLTLIAGAFADRILPYVSVGAQVTKGERLGIIKFGSRVDFTIPVDDTLALCVKVGDTVKAAETSLFAPAKEAMAH